MLRGVTLSVVNSVESGLGQKRYRG